MTNNYKYMVCSGWWCSENEQHSTERTLMGDEFIRSKDFHLHWYEAVNKFCSPQNFFIVDSASPVKPPLNLDDKRIEFVSLLFNAGHAAYHTGKYCGWMRAVLLAMEYCYLSDCEYFVYVEQDVLLYGDNIVEKCISAMKKNVMLGSGEGTPQPLQQSFFIVKRDFIPDFARRIKAIPYTDGEMSPEVKFFCALAPWFVPHFVFNNKRMRNFLLNIHRPFDELPFGFGRKRPINFNVSHFYFQHGSKEELEKYKMLF